MILKRLFNRPLAPERRCYEAIVAAARHPAFYARWQVADTLDGRFDMVALHTYLILDRLKGVEPEFRQALVDEFFRDMDRSLRELGVGDVSVGKKVRKMAEVFYGRITAYDAALAGPETQLVDAVARKAPGLVLADIQLADGSSGIDAVKDILGHYDIPVIFITAFPERLLTGERPEPTFLITKPFQPETVKAAIGQALFFHPRNTRKAA
mgnify:CR=1 FL=1